MPVRVTPEQAQTKWVNRLSGATSDIQAGVARVTTAPGQQAAAKADKWLANVTAAQAKWKRNVGNVSLDDWKNYMTNVGIPRIAQGAQAKQQKFGNFAQQFFPYLAQGVAKVEAMPDTTYEQRVNKAVAMMGHNHAFKRSATGQ